MIPTHQPKKDTVKCIAGVGVFCEPVEIDFCDGHAFGVRARGNDRAPWVDDDRVAERGPLRIVPPNL
jgi:hypothetical protein